MDHALRSISYIADIGDLLVIMARRRLVPPGSTAAPPVTAGNTSDASTNASGGAGSTASNSTSVIPTSSASALAAACDDVQVIGTTPKMICHVFESEEVNILKSNYVFSKFLISILHKANNLENITYNSLIFLGIESKILTIGRKR